MSKLLLPFWNFDERRIRSFWRLLLQIALLLAFLIIISIGIAALVASMVAASGIPPTDPRFSGAVSALFLDPNVDALTRVGMLVAIVLSVIVAGWLLDRRPFYDFGFRFSRRWWTDFAFGLALGAVLMLGIFLIELAMGWVTITGVFRSRGNFGLGILVYAISFIAVGIQEELFSRGYQLRNMAEGMNWRWIGPRVALLIGYVASSMLFGALHLANPNTSAISTINLMIAGLFLGLGFILTGELAIPIGLHITWNFFQGNVFGFPVSGLTIDSTVMAIQQGGPDWMTGGAFGPEAGLLGLGAMFVGSVLTILWVRWRYGHAALQNRLAQYNRPTQV